MHPNEKVISDFYSAFQRGDHETMAASYSDRAVFSDPVFPELNAEEVRAMWRMFCTGGNDIDITFERVQANDAAGSAHWEARYKFPKTGRPVHNKIDASFEFADGLIARHRDNFDLYRWTRMALGPTGSLLGWTPMVQKKVQGQAASQLRRFQAQST